jgi:DNA end-binding protein Ku
MPRSIWKGTLAFGLVSIPVKLYGAVVDRNVRFHQLHATDHARIQQRRVCSADGEEVPYEEIVKGFQIAPEHYVVIAPDELAALEPARTGQIEIEDFVELEEIDPIYFDQPYYLVPNTGGARPYRLLLEAMRATGRVAIARVVLRSRERLVAIRPRADVLVMATMNFSDEIQQTDDLEELHQDDVQPTERELAVARRLVESIAEPFEIARYRDTYREALLEMIDRKAGGEEVVAQPAATPQPLQAPDLMSALEASLEQVRGRQGSDGAAARPRRPASKRGGAPVKPGGAPVKGGGASTRGNGATAKGDGATANSDGVAAKGKKKTQRA